MTLENLLKLDPENAEMAYGGYDVLRHVLQIEKPEDLDVPGLRQEIANLFGLDEPDSGIRVLFRTDVTDVETDGDGFAGPGEHLVFGLSGLYERYILGRDTDWAEVYVVPAQKVLEFLSEI